MALKRIFVDIQDDLFDLWNIISAERGPDDYNEAKGVVEFTLVLNSGAVTRDIKDKVYKFADEDARDNLLFSIKEALKKNPNIYFLGEDDGTINDDELRNAGYNKNRNDDEEG
jgi:hypothetical protein